MPSSRTFGAKRQLAGRIVEAVGRHQVYWEPFCGSLAVLLSKPPVRMETACDLNGDMTNLARVLANRQTAEALYADLYRLVPAAALHREFGERMKAATPPGPDPADVERAYLFFVASWLGRNGQIGTTQTGNGFCVRYTGNGGSPAKRWASAVDSIPDWHERLKNVMVLTTDGIAACGRIDDAEGTAIYVDPPYVAKAAKYLHDFDDQDHVRLAAALNRFTATKVVVSYYAHPRLAELYPGWKLIDCTVTKSLVNQGRRDAGGAVKAPEVLLLNGPAAADYREDATDGR